MEDFLQLCGVLQNEYNARRVPLSLRDYARMCLESLADLISEDHPEQFQSAMAHFFAALYGGNELFNRLPVPSRNNLNSVTIGIPPRRLFELLNDIARVINELSLLEMSSRTVRSSLQENGFPYRPNEFFSLLEQFEQLDQSFTETTDRTIPATEELPFGIQRCDVPKTLKREGYYHISIENEDYWNLMQALMTAWPNAVSESKLNQMFPYPNGRKNASQKLKGIIDALGLTFKNWVLTEWNP